MVYTGTEGDDEIILESGAPWDEWRVIYGLGGNDHLVGAVLNDNEIHGGLGNDTLEGGMHANLMFGDEGDDYLGGFNIGDSTMHGGAGNDTLDAAACSHGFLDGGSGADVLIGGYGEDVYVVNSRDDTAREYYDDHLSWHIDEVRSSVSWTLGAGIENLVLTGPGASNGFGNALANLMVGNDAANVLDGGPQGTAGDTMQGGGGDDTYIVDRTSDRAIETTTLAGHVDAGGLDLVRSSVTYTLGDFVENLSLNGSSSIRGTGNALANWINGNAADNLLSGAAGDDTIVGNAGDDTLNGGAGNDRLSGSAGADIFRFSSALDSVTNVDTILWFDASEDGIQLNDAVFENIGPTGTLAAGAFAIGTAATQADDRVIYDPTTGHLLYDADGSGAAQAVLFAVLAPNTELSALDFFVI